MKVNEILSQGIDAILRPSESPAGIRWRRSALIRMARNLYRVFWPYWPSYRTWAGFKHRINAPQASYRKNCRKLLVHLAQKDVKRAGRPVVAISQIFHMGDIVACEPVIRRVRGAFPNAFVIMCVQRNYAELVECHPDIDYVLPLECLTEWIYFAQSALFDQIIDLNMHRRACGLCGVEWVKPEGSRGVTVDNYFNWGGLLQAYARSAGLEPFDEGPRVFISTNCERSIEALELPAVFVSLHAGSNKQETQLPPHVWQHVVRHVNCRWKLPVVEIGLHPLVIDVNDRFNRTLCGTLSIMQSAEVIRRSGLYLGSDSGPAHLANAMGTYGVIALGHYRHSRKYVPYSGAYASGVNCQLLHHDGPVSGMPVDKILDAVDGWLGKCLQEGETSSSISTSPL